MSNFNLSGLQLAFGFLCLAALSLDTGWRRRQPFTSTIIAKLVLTSVVISTLGVSTYYLKPWQEANAFWPWLKSLWPLLPVLAWKSFTTYCKRKARLDAEWEEKAQQARAQREIDEERRAHENKIQEEKNVHSKLASYGLDAPSMHFGSSTADFTVYYLGETGRLEQMSLFHFLKLMEIKAQYHLILPKACIYLGKEDSRAELGSKFWSMSHNPTEMYTTIVDKHGDMLAITPACEDPAPGDYIRTQLQIIADYDSVRHYATWYRSWLVADELRRRESSSDPKQATLKDKELVALLESKDLTPFVDRTCPSYVGLS